MTIVNLFRRYKRWNPVHPTYGAFWGIGVGLGCGVGWGPGFGPEVVGYVGSGCGVGVSMGVTLVGVGVGLPASGLTCVPCNVITGAGHQVSTFSTWLAPIVSNVVSRSRDSMASQITLFDQQLRLTSQRISQRGSSLVPMKILRTPGSVKLHSPNSQSGLKTTAALSNLPHPGHQDSFPANPQ